MGYLQEKTDESKMHNDQSLKLLTGEIVTATLELFPESVYQILLYGSYARGDFTAESDIDLMVLLNCTKEEANAYRKKANKMASRLSLKHDIEVSLLLRDRQTFESGQEVLPFYQNIINEGILLYG